MAKRKETPELSEYEQLRIWARQAWNQYRTHAPASREWGEDFEKGFITGYRRAKAVYEEAEKSKQGSLFAGKK